MRVCVCVRALGTGWGVVSLSTGEWANNQTHILVWSHLSSCSLPSPPRQYLNVFAWALEAPFYRTEITIYDTMPWLLMHSGHLVYHLPTPSRGLAHYAPSLIFSKDEIRLRFDGGSSKAVLSRVSPDLAQIEFVSKQANSYLKQKSVYFRGPSVNTHTTSSQLSNKHKR